MTERLVFGGEKNKNNAFHSYYIAFTLSFKKVLISLTSRLSTCLFLFSSITDGMSIFRTLRVLLFSVPTSLPPAKKCRQSGHAAGLESSSYRRH